MRFTDWKPVSATNILTQESRPPSTPFAALTKYEKR